MRTVFSILFIAASIVATAQNSLILKKQRPPQLDVSNYAQVAVGDIVGPLGSKTEQSLDLTDMLTANLFNANTLEVLDRNALDNILGSQRTKDLQVIDESTKQLLNKKLSKAILISGRIQSQQLEQKLKYQDQSVVVNGCNRKYWYEVKGDVAIQLKILDIKTGRMIYSDAIVIPVSKQTSEMCETPNKLDLGEITRNAIKDLAKEISKLIIPYEVTKTLQFSEPGLFKSPFKKMKEAVASLQLSNPDAGLAILKDYTESKDIKDKVRDDAWFNYGLGLLYTGKNTDARIAFQKCASLNAQNASYVAELLKFIEEEESTARRMEAIAAARQKKQQEDEAENNAATNVPKEKSAPKKPAAKPKAKG